MTARIGPVALTLYSIERDHDTGTGFYRVHVPEAGHSGVGIQVGVKRRVLGASVIVIGRPTPGKEG